MTDTLLTPTMVLRERIDGLPHDLTRISAHAALDAAVRLETLQGGRAARGACHDAIRRALAPMSTAELIALWRVCEPPMLPGPPKALAGEVRQLVMRRERWTIREFFSRALRET